MPTDDRRIRTQPLDRRAMDLLDRTHYGRVAVSLGALPVTVVTRHIVAGEDILLRMHRGYGYHRACDGHVIGYAADTLHHEATGAAGELWSVQCVGTARLATPTAAELERFGPAPRSADDAPFEAVFLRVSPQFVTVHHIAGIAPRQLEHSP